MMMIKNAAFNPVHKRIQTYSRRANCGLESRRFAVQIFLFLPFFLFFFPIKFFDFFE